mmetsp:Transcript_30347/g.44906  ORF Transcript_30347/g.44906 Transcript_30347/m.44906 type:complete len:138 (+) Transcript_30347:227-640(+)|eukprot:CAMPEP_0195508904 /NCGR_PEP_ID=MMETSP0794_2-20130614/1991_1 /TAXON_ID=515487 /ORGANISM="Stephanopyxis turris, Strain CCMP 815" /LENGTH=137 /DNA_ID=CAMNT_0040635995 /DNA_START=308 /DNA_END=721 /DNA_ORIENTATION=-
MPLLKSFLKDGEAETYKNVEIEYIRGRKAELIIFNDTEETERILLSAYKTKEEMHALMVSKGFVKKSKEEIEKEIAEKEEEKKIKTEELAESRRMMEERGRKEQEEKERQIRENIMKKDMEIRRRAEEETKEKAQEL